jgi:hypothetical protein
MAYPGSPLHREAIKKGWPLPDSWAGYSQHSYECLPLPTDTLPASEILKFRDEAFHEYFSHPRYLDMVAQRFGWETREHIKGMSQHRLRRLIVEQTEA